MSAGSWSKLQKISTVLFGAVGGATAYYFYTRKQESNTVFNSWTTNFEVSPCGKWDSNWDHREPTSIVKPLKKDVDATEENKYNDKLEKATPKAIRHLILIRHGQYNQSGESDSKHYLTEIGRKQAAFTGDRLKLLQINWDKMIKSTLLRAQETGSIISTSLPQVPVENCSLLEEGAPIPPEPPIGHWKPEKHQFFQDGARIEAAFRKYFHRASPEQTKDSYTLLVCHANVIRYFVCRALQFPPEAWLRISLNHASVTWISILPSGRVLLRGLGDSGHIPPEYVTCR
uniref:Serine/threonine-protein phosphatase PGAM5, mitochondrial n=1 Tax=Lutzomyia longipalpis TaxID=7200 RepID=A0A7G3AY73_LUTLO